MMTWLVRMTTIVCGLVVFGTSSNPLGGQPNSPASPISITNQSPGQSVKLSPYQSQVFYRSKAAMQWLMRFNQPGGRFLYGYIPSLAVPLLEDNYTHQVATTYALARAAQLSGDKKAAALARQALLTLLLETETDPNDPQIRRPLAGESALASAGWLVMAIHSLPNPGADLLDQSEQLCRFIRSQQQKEGSFSAKKGQSHATHGVEAGPALYGLALSAKHRPANWKWEVIRRACGHYHTSWRAQKVMDMVPLHTAAYSLAYLHSKEKMFADCVLEMNDWICTRQYQQVGTRRIHWFGGFVNSLQQTQGPDVHSAIYSEGLAHACQIVRSTGDLRRYNHYRAHIERCLQFLSTLQFTQANTGHIVDRYKGEILGAFHYSHLNGTIRIDYVQEALCAHIQYLDSVAPLSRNPSNSSGITRKP